MGLVLALSESSKAESDTQWRMQVVDFDGNPKEQEECGRYGEKANTKAAFGCNGAFQSLQPLENHVDSFPELSA